MTNDENAQSDACASSSAFGIRHSAFLPCRLIIDPPQPGAWNMAVDEALLESAINDGVATLRFYQWSEPTLSLGYFQKHADRELHAASRGCPFVRRHSGGGAILHDQELTYSLSLPADAPQVRDPEAIYRQTHEALLAALAAVTPDAAGQHPVELCSAPIDPPGGQEPFLCFQRRARCDVTLSAGDSRADSVDGRHKICGSAQRKRRGAVLQHGSLLLRRSAAAPELAGLGDLVEAPIDEARIRAGWVKELSKTLALDPREQPLTSQERGSAQSMADAQFAALAWNQRR